MKIKSSVQRQRCWLIISSRNRYSVYKTRTSKYYKHRQPIWACNTDQEITYIKSIEYHVTHTEFGRVWNLRSRCGSCEIATIKRTGWQFVTSSGESMLLSVNMCLCTISRWINPHVLCMHGRFVFIDRWCPSKRATFGVVSILDALHPVDSEQTVIIDPYLSID